MNPLSAVFGAGAGLRNTLYDRHWLPIRKLERPVVSVGNVSVGGTGKTPFVIALGELLKGRNISFDVLSRGYGRRSKDVAVVDPAGTSQQFGDEPLLIARKLQVPVVVGADRWRAGLLAERSFDSKLHLLDDGFQHRRLHRDFDIVMLRADDFRDTLLPAGRLREPVSAWRRADVVASTDHVVAIEKPIWPVRRVMDRVQKQGRFIAFCGIARPQQFFAGLIQPNVGIVETISFWDHHRYTEKDIDRLLKSKAKLDADGFVTTEKDLMNLGDLAGHLAPLEVIRLSQVFLHPEEALTFLLTTLEQRCGCRL